MSLSWNMSSRDRSWRSSHWHAKDLAVPDGLEASGFFRELGSSMRSPEVRIVSDETRPSMTKKLNVHKALSTS